MAWYIKDQGFICEEGVEVSAREESLDQLSSGDIVDLRLPVVPHLEYVHILYKHILYKHDLGRGFGRVYFPDALRRKYPTAAKKWGR